MDSNWELSKTYPRTWERHGKKFIAYVWGPDGNWYWRIARFERGRELNGVNCDSGPNPTTKRWAFEWAGRFLAAMDHA